MEKYYKSLYLKELNKVNLDFVNKHGYGFRVFESISLNCKIAEMLNKRMEVTFVVYYSLHLSEQIQNYHTTKYDDSVMVGIAEELHKGIKICFYRNGSISMYSVETFYDNGLSDTRQEFNANFELHQYCKCFYNEDNMLSKEVYFFADSWTVHTENL